MLVEMKIRNSSLSRQLLDFSYVGVINRGHLSMCVFM